ncbi:MAG TPA: caspase family protein [Nakamurella sp.]
MNSVARRVLGRDAIVEFPAGARSAGIDVPGPPSVGGAAASERPSSGVASGWPAAPGGSRKALCVGIDAYPDPYTLGGCVADMTVWAGALRGRGFSVRTLQDGEATRTGILDQLTELITTAVPGDVLAFQYSGHGTQVPDLDGDEALDAINDDKDEAICPVDFDTGALIIDDELFAAFSALPAGVSLTTFFDCCHSGTNTKALNILAPAPAPIGTRRKRYIPATAALIAAHKLFRRTRAAGAAPVIANQQLRNVSIAACRDEEVAYESNGQGHFTKYAMQVLGVPGGELSNRSFTERVTALFGRFPEQRPLLHCRSELTDRPLLSGPGGTADGAAAATGAAATGAAATAAPTPDSRSSDGAVDAVSDILRSVVTLLEQH